MIVDGRALAQKVLARAKTRAQELSHSPNVLGIVVNATPATQSYLRIKEKRATDAGCVFEVQRFSEDTKVDIVRDAVVATSADTVIVQLPLPAGIDTKEVCNAIPLEKDADVLSSFARTKFERGDVDALLPPVVAAVREIFIQNNIEVRGKRAIVIGNGWLVGNPCAVWLKQQGANVSILTSSDGDVSTALRVADIIVSGAGVPHLIKPGYLKQGVVLIDAATSESNGVIVGDADPSCAEKCAVFTPVPGGVGPLTVACLFENAVLLVSRAGNGQ